MKNDKKMRPLTIERGYTKNAAGSVLVSFGNTKVICSASVDEKVPPFLRNQGRGWLTAEYSLLPSATSPRARREVTQGKPSGRTSEIQRLIGRSLRSVLDFDLLGERTIYIDTDVIQADGGTRTAAITGGMVALYDAVQGLVNSGELQENPIKKIIAAVSVGVVDGDVVCDLCYEQDSSADVDMNVVMTDAKEFVEVQGTGENDTFDRATLNEMLDVAEEAIIDIIGKIKDILNLK